MSENSLPHLTEEESQKAAVDGIGATDELIEKLNKTPHYMLCDENTTEQRHGLGLFIVKQIVSSHSEKIIIDHSIYGGLKAVLALPK